MSVAAPFPLCLLAERNWRRESSMHGLRTFREGVEQFAIHLPVVDDLSNFVLGYAEGMCQRCHIVHRLTVIRIG